MSKILIIDDDIPLLTSLQVRLEKEDFQVLTAESGTEGVKAAKREKPNLIVLDLAMPDIDGVQVLDQLRKSIVTWEIPVVVLAAEGTPENRERIRQLGVSRFLQKPFSPQHLVSEIVGVLRKIRASS